MRKTAINPGNGRSLEVLGKKKGPDESEPWKWKSPALAFNVPLAESRVRGVVPARIDPSETGPACNALVSGL